MKIDLSDFDCTTLIRIIDNTTFKGSDVEYVSALKDKFRSKPTLLEDKLCSKVDNTSSVNLEAMKKFLNPMNDL